MTLTKNFNLTEPLQARGAPRGLQRVQPHRVGAAQHDVRQRHVRPGDHASAPTRSAARSRSACGSSSDAPSRWRLSHRPVADGSQARRGTGPRGHASSRPVLFVGASRRRRAESSRTSRRSVLPSAALARRRSRSLPRQASMSRDPRLHRLLPAPSPASPVLRRRRRRRPTAASSTRPTRSATRVIDFSHAGYEGGGVRAARRAGADRRSAPTAGRARATDPGRDRPRVGDDAGRDRDSAAPSCSSRARTSSTAPAHRRVRSRAARVGHVGDRGRPSWRLARDRGSLLIVSGRGERQESAGTRRAVADAYVPAGARDADPRARRRAPHRRPRRRASPVHEGVDRAASAWTRSSAGGRRTGCTGSPAPATSLWDRRVTAIDGNRITLDAPITTALDAALGGGAVFRYSFDGRIDHVGVEHLRLVSRVDPARPADEDHAWVAITLDKVDDAWVRQVEARQFACYVVYVGADARAVTVEDVRRAGSGVRDRRVAAPRVLHRRPADALPALQRASGGRHDFAVGHRRGGPERVPGRARRGRARLQRPARELGVGRAVRQRHRPRQRDPVRQPRARRDRAPGWSAANSVIWNGEATDVEVDVPPGAYNQAYGCTRHGDGRRDRDDDPRALPVPRLLSRHARRAAQPVPRAVGGAARRGGRAAARARARSRRRPPARAS